MVIFFNKKTIFKSVFGILLAVSLALNISTKENAVLTSATVLSTKTIIIDAGHGYPDGGAVGESGILEKDINLSVSKHLGKLFVQCGSKVLYTRENDNSIAYTGEEKTIRETKNQDMKMRKNIIDSSNADIFISIHTNKFENEKYFGAQVFYDDDNGESKKLANCIQESLKTNLDTNNTRVAANTNGNIYILKNNEIPSVLIECGFLSNKDEEKLLSTELYRQKIAFAVFAGTMKYLSK